MYSDNPIHDSELTLYMCVFLNNTPNKEEVPVITERVFQNQQIALSTSCSEDQKKITCSLPTKKLKAVHGDIRITAKKIVSLQQYF